VQGKLPKLGELELAVLEHLWKARELDVAEAHAVVGAHRGITPNTVGSALERLHKKGLVRRRKVSHAFRYAPALESDEFAARRVLDAAGGLGKLSSAGLMAAFVDLVADHDERALERLSLLIARKKRSRGAK
jgi:predicted transcriptional regulator